MTGKTEGRGRWFASLLIVLAAALPPRAGAQQIHGIVTSEGTGAGVAGAEVSARSPDGNVLATVRTDAVGRFVMRLPFGGRMLLSARRDGYLSVDEVPIDVSSLILTDVILSLEPEAPPAPPRPVHRPTSPRGPDLDGAGFHVRIGTSGNSSFVSPRGFGAGADVRLTERVGVRVDAGRYDARVDRAGRTCRQIQPLDRFCIDEAIMGSTTLTSLEVAATLSLDLVGPVGAVVGIGPIVGVLGSEAQGASGRLADVALPKTAHLGLAGLAELRVFPDALPLALTAGFRFQRLLPDGRLGDPPFTEQPFCGPLHLRWGQFGIGWRR